MWIRECHISGTSSRVSENENNWPFNYFAMKFCQSGHTILSKTLFFFIIKFSLLLLVTQSIFKKISLKCQDYSTKLTQI